MALRIKVTRTEFEAAAANGCVYGLVRGKRGLYVYAELGREEEYIFRPNDDPKADYRLFLNCDAFFALTEEQLDEGIFVAEEPDITVIIYC
jgi:hypothetical protein